jgi:hypothetical protein
MLPSQKFLMRKKRTLKHQPNTGGVDQIDKDQKQSPVLAVTRGSVVWVDPVFEKSVASFGIGDDFRAGRDRLKSLPSFQVFHCWLLVKKVAPPVAMIGGAVVL